jgi:ribosomal protein S12 methylthiotransferase accessory factor
VNPIQDTLAQIEPICNEIGVTRLCDITHMDRLDIPNFSAVLPGTDDVFWVYNGKGTSKLSAKVSALMEAIERYSSLSSTYSKPFIRGENRQLSEVYGKVLNPAEVIEPVSSMYDDNCTTMDYVLGYDLLASERILVPAEIALYQHHPRHPAVGIFKSHTNGLASGIALEEAICHALCEVIERDAVSIAELCASSIEFTILQSVLDSFTKIGKVGRFISPINIGNIFVDNPNIFPDVDISEIAKEFEPINRLVTKFTSAKLPLTIKDITQKDIGIPVFSASSVEWITHDYGYFAKGYGAHPDARIALARAITEVSQTRAANIHGARDDLKRINYKANDEIYKRKWQFMPSCSCSQYAQQKTNTVKFSGVQSYVTEDILDDVSLILAGLANAGLKRAIIVDLTNHKIGIPVVRAIVPGLETFEVTQSVMGKRAKDFYKSYLYG